MQKEIWIIYDGECPLCNFASKRIKLQQAAGTIVLLNAREEHPLNLALREKGLDYNQGFIVKMGDNLYQGAAAMQMLALLSTNSDIFNKLNGMVFRSKTLATLLYPILKAIRAVLLLLKPKHHN